MPPGCRNTSTPVFTSKCANKKPAKRVKYQSKYRLRRIQIDHRLWCCSKTPRTASQNVFVPFALGWYLRRSCVGDVYVVRALVMFAHNSIPAHKTAHFSSGFKSDGFRSTSTLSLLLLLSISLWLSSSMSSIVTVFLSSGLLESLFASSLSLGFTCWWKHERRNRGGSSDVKRISLLLYQNHLEWRRHNINSYIYACVEY